MALSPQNDVFGPVAVVLGCAVGAVIGGILDGVLSDRGGGGFSAFGAVFGLMLGGLIGAGVWEFGRPVLRLIAVLTGGAPTPEPVPVTIVPPSPPAQLDPNRPSVLGRVLQGVVAAAALVGGMWLLALLARPVANLTGLPMFMVLPAGLFLLAAGVTAAWRGGAALAVHLDMTAE
jgi:hypothetical protein